MKKIPFQITFIIVLLLVIMGGELGIKNLVYTFKPALMLVLIVWVTILHTFKHHLRFIIALFFSLLGDVFLMLPNPDFFILGLGSFLLTHLFYISIFYKKAKPNWLVISIYLFILSSYYFGLLNNQLTDSFRAPVVIYMLVLTTMAIVLTSTITNRATKLYLLIGSALFVISDSLIAFDKFINPIQFRSILILSTYGLAQLLITMGYLQIFTKEKG